MRANMGNPGMVEALHERAEGWMKHARGLLNTLALGLMLASGTAYASTPHAHSYNNVVDDSITNWVIVIFAIIIGMFITLIVLDARKNGRQ